MTTILYTHAFCFCFKCKHKSLHEVTKTYYESYLEKVKTKCLRCGHEIERRVYGEK